MFKQRFFKKPKIANKFLVLFLLMALLPLILLGYVIYSDSTKALKKAALNNLIAIADSKARQIETYIIEREKNVTTLARTPTIIDAMEKFDVAFKKGGIDSPEYSAIDKGLRPFLRYYKEAFGFSDLFLISPEGDAVFSVMRGEDLGSNYYTGPYRYSELAKAFGRAKTLSETGVSDFEFYPVTNEPAAFIAAPIFRERRVIGVVAFQLSNEEVYSLVQDYTGLGETGETVIASKRGDQVIFVTPIRHDPYAAFRRNIGFQEDLPIQEAVRGIKRAGVAVDYRGKEVLAVQRYLPHINLGMVVKIDTEEAFALVLSLRNWSLIIGIITVLGAVLLSLLVSKSISDPIVKLTRTAKLIADGDLTSKIDIKLEDEIGQLAAAFNEMSVKLNESYAALEEKVKERTEELSKTLEKVEEQNKQLEDTKKVMLNILEDREAAITELKRVEEALRDSEQRLYSVIQGSPIPAFVIGKDHRIIYWNKALEELCKIRADEVMGTKYHWKAFYSEERPCMADLLVDEALETIPQWYSGKFIKSKLIEEAYEATDFFPALGEGGKWLRFTAAVIRDSLGKSVGAIEILEDITVRKQAEEALEKANEQLEIRVKARTIELAQANEALLESEKRYRTILDNIEDGYYEVDLAGNFTFFNNSLCKMLGYSKEEMMGMNNRVYMDKEASKKVSQVFNRVYSTGEPDKTFEFKIIRKDITIRFLESPVSLITNAKGEPIGFKGIARDITERKKAEEALAQSEERYRTLVEESFDGIFIQKGFKIIFANRRLYEMLGYGEGELEGLDHWLVYHPDYQSLTRERAQARMRGESVPSTYEVKFLRKDGSSFWGEIHAKAITLRGEPGVQVWARDISERKQADEMIKESEEKYRSIFENAVEGIYRSTLEGRFLNVNPAMARIFGYESPHQMVASITDIAQQLYVEPTTRQTFIHSLETGEVLGLEYEAYRKDGSTIWITDSARVVRGTDGTLLFLEGFIEDITVRKQAEEEFQKSEERYRNLFEKSKDAVYITSREGKFIDVNPAFLDLFGYSREELNVLLVQDAYANPSDRYHFRQKMEENGFVRDYEVKLRKKDGAEMDCLIIATLRRDNDGTVLGYQGIIRDITERKQNEKEMANLQEQLRQSQKMEAIGGLAGGVAHDFNNLLTVIKGYSQLSLLDIKENDPLKGNIEEIQKASERAANLTRQLLAFSRRQILDLKVINLNTTIQDFDKMLHRILGEDIELVYVLAEDLGKVKTDPGQIEQVVLNLAVNARDAMPSGGKLTIETLNMELSEAYAQTHMEVTPGHYVMLSVSDSGAGMAPKVRERIFEPFFTTKEKGKGTGLGLSTVYGIVKQSGGNINVYSEPGFGTTFKIYLPRVEEEEDHLQRKDLDISLSTGNETILLTEDEQSVRELAARILRDRGYQVYEAPDGREALAIAQRHPERKIHLLLTDVVMPGMSGKELADRLKLSMPDIKVLFISGYTDNAIVHHGVLDKGVNFIQKPFSMESLARKVREVLDR